MKTGTIKALLTKSNNLPPVPSSPMAVECRVSSTGTHFPCCDCGRICVGPPALDVFSMSPPHTRAIIERVLCVTTGPMRRQMKLWNKIFQGKLTFGDTEFWRVLLGPLKQIDRPATSNVIGNLDYLDRLVFHRGKEDIVHVDKPNSISI